MGREVLLVNTNRIRPAVGPVGLDYAADVLRERGFAVRLLDLCFEEDVEDAVAVALRGSEPLLVGLTLRKYGRLLSGERGGFRAGVRPGRGVGAAAYGGAGGGWGEWVLDVPRSDPKNLQQNGLTWGEEVDIEPADGPETSYAVLLKTLYGRRRR